MQMPTVNGGAVCPRSRAAAPRALRVNLAPGGSAERGFVTSFPCTRARAATAAAPSGGATPDGASDPTYAEVGPVTASCPLDPRALAFGHIMAAS
jgi:hypothetical protein